MIDFAKLVTSGSDEEFNADIAKYLDLDEFARFMAMTVWLANGDSILAMGQNFYVYLDPESNKFQFLPWDLDLSFGRFGMGRERGDAEESGGNAEAQRRRDAEEGKR